MRRISLEKFQALDISDKVPFLCQGKDVKRIFHVLFAQQFKRKDLDVLCNKISETLAGAATG